MADRPTITVEVDGQEVEAELPDGFVPEDKVREEYVPRSALDSEVNRRVKKVKGDLSRELMESDDFVARLVDLRGDELKDMLGVEEGADPEKIERAVQQRVTPLENRLEEMEQERNRLRSRALDAEIREAMDAVGVVDDQSVRDLLPQWLRSRVEWDEEHGGWFVTNGDGFAYSSDPSRGEAPYKTVQELLAEDRKAGEHKGWYAARSRDGIDYSGSRGAQGLTVEQFSKMGQAEQRKVWDRDPDLYRQLMREKRRQGEEALRNPFSGEQ